VPPISSVAYAPPPYVSQQNFSTEGSCIICYEDMDTMNTLTTRRLDCGHYFHKEVRRKAEKGLMGERLVVTRMGLWLISLARKGRVIQRGGR